MKLWGSSVWHHHVVEVTREDPTNNRGERKHRIRRLWSEQCGVLLIYVFLRIHLMGVNRPMCMYREFCVCIVAWQNGTRCRDSVKILCCYSHLAWLVFEGSITTCAFFRSENFFVTSSCFLGMVREKRGLRGGQGKVVCKRCL